MNMNSVVWKSLAYAASLFFVCCSNAGEWSTVGAGNVTCEYWKTSDENGKIEILSWMAGFSSASNLIRVSAGRPEFRLDLMTYEYLRNEVNSACSESANRKKEIR